METIDKAALTQRLIDEGYVPENGLDHTVQNLLNLATLPGTAPAYEMLVEWMRTGRLRKFEPVEGIDLRFLRDRLRMKDPAAILAYGMLLFDPKRNAMFLRREATRRNAASF